MDNASVNAPTAALLRKPMIGCHAHRFNLAARSWKQHVFGERAGEHMKQAHAWVKQASTIKNVARLKTHSKYKSLLRNQTRWTSGQIMIKRFV
jgi:hypothetical protein